MQADTSTIRVSSSESSLLERLAALGKKAGSHSPSLAAIHEALPEITVDVDACFLSNPLATKLFWSCFNTDLLEDRGVMSRILGAYPSQNRVIAERFASPVGAAPQNVFVSNGANEAIQAVLRNYASAIHINLPTYSPYYEFANSNQRVVTFQLDPAKGFELDPEEYVRSVVESGADTAILISPNNPDGYLIPDDHLRWILCKLACLRTVIVDESFIHFSGRSPEHELPTLLEVTAPFDNVTLIKSMSKDFGVAGIRAGYAIMGDDRVRNLLDHGYLWNINGIAEYFFSLFSREDFLDAYRDALDTYLGFIDDFNRMTAAADYLGCYCYPTRANFQLIGLPDGVSAELVAGLLLIRHGIYVRGCGDKVGLQGEYLRIAIRTKSENRRVLEALTDVLG